MTISLKPLKEQVIVITGASSGIGLATARKAAEQGARVVLAARSGDSLAAIVQEIKAAGGDAVHVVADVGSREEVQRIADAAIAKYGGFDTWVNDAAVSIWGRLEEISDADHQRLFQTNFWGVVFGSLVALPTLKQRGGALINLGSVASDMAHPLQGMYAASKHAIKGFTDSLRIELEHENAPVSVTLIKPGSIDTPFPEHARKYTAEQPNLPAPVYAPDEVANAILYAAAHPKRDIYVGSSARTLSLLSRGAPRLIDKVGSTLLYSGQLRNEPARDREGGLHEARGGARTRGDQPGYIMKTSLYSRASRHPVLTGLIVAAAGVGVYTLMTRRKTRANPTMSMTFQDGDGLRDPQPLRDAPLDQLAMQPADPTEPTTELTTDDISVVAPNAAPELTPAGLAAASEETTTAPALSDETTLETERPKAAPELSRTS